MSDITLLQPGDFIYQKRHLCKNSLQPHWKGPCLVLTNLPLCCQTLRDRLLGLCVPAVWTLSGSATQLVTEG